MYHKNVPRQTQYKRVILTSNLKEDGNDLLNENDLYSTDYLDDEQLDQKGKSLVSSRYMNADLYSYLGNAGKRAPVKKYSRDSNFTIKANIRVYS